MIFADTSALFALFNPNDEFHNTAKAISRGGNKFALTISKQVRVLAGIKKITEEDFNKAWEIFDSYQDKNWSLTDCTSYVFMNRTGIKKAFAIDPHFNQFGNISCEPIL